MRGHISGRLLSFACVAAIVGAHVGCSVVNSFGNVAPQKDRGVIVIGGVVANGAADEYVLTALDPLTGKELANARRTMTVAAVQYSGANDLWYVFESGVVSHFFPLPTDPFYVHVMRLDPFAGTWTELSAAAIPPALSFLTTAVLTDRIAYIAYANGRSDQLQLVLLDTSDPSAIHESASVPITSSPVALVGLPAAVNETQRVLLCSTAQPRPVAPTGSDAGDPGNDDSAGPPTDDGGDDASGDDASGDDTGDAGAASDDGAFSGPEAGAPAEAGAPGGAATTAATLTEYFVSSGPPSAQAQITVPSIGPLVGFARVTPSGSAPMALVVASPIRASVATVSLYDPVNLSSSVGTFAFNDSNVQPPAFSPCDSYLFVVGTNVATSVYAVDLTPLLNAGGSGGTQSLVSTYASTGNSGQGLYFEPYTKTVLAPFSQGASFTLTAFSVSTADGVPHLTQRSSPGWTPPGDLRPNFVATKSPASFTQAFCAASGQ
jgi:hypothetical protein